MADRKDDPDRPRHAVAKLGPWSLSRGFSGDMLAKENRRVNMAGSIPKDSIITLRKFRKD